MERRIIRELVKRAYDNWVKGEAYWWAVDMSDFNIPLNAFSEYMLDTLNHHTVLTFPKVAKLVRELEDSNDNIPYIILHPDALDEIAVAELTKHARLFQLREFKRIGSLTCYEVYDEGELLARIILGTGCASLINDCP